MDVAPIARLPTLVVPEYALHARSADFGDHDFSPSSPDAVARSAKAVVRAGRERRLLVGASR